MHFFFFESGKRLHSIAILEGCHEEPREQYEQVLRISQKQPFRCVGQKQFVFMM